MKAQFDTILFAMMVFLACSLLFGGQSDAGARLAENIVVGMLAYMRGAEVTK
jgi:hypothetical protein